MITTALREDPDFSDAVITEAIRWAEQNGPLYDAQAMRIAAQAPHTAARIAERARQLGERLGLQAELHRARQWSPWVLLGLVALIVMAGLALAGNVVGSGERHINVIVALVSLLGVHLLTLLLWLLGLWLPLASFGSASLGWIWLSLTARVAGGRHGQAPLLVRATTDLLGRAKLLPWAFGIVSHGIWSLSFAVVLAAMLFALAFRSYTELGDHHPRSRLLRARGRCAGLGAVEAGLPGARCRHRAGRRAAGLGPTHLGAVAHGLHPHLRAAAAPRAAGLERRRVAPAPPGAAARARGAAAARR